MKTFGNCGRSGRDYTGAESVLNGVLASDELKVYPEGSDTDEALIAERCQHGEVVAWHTLRSRQQNDRFHCKECAWLYAWREAK